jgi:hypothetical protein
VSGFGINDFDTIESSIREIRVVYLIYTNFQKNMKCQQLVIHCFSYFCGAGA